MTAPIVNDRVAQSHANEIYGDPNNVATRSNAASWQARAVNAAHSATLGALFWILLYTLGIPYAIHIGGLDGLLLSALAGGLFGRGRLRPLLWAAVVITTAVLLLVAYTPIVGRLVAPLIRVDPLPQNADAIVVLSAGIDAGGVLSPQAADRLLTGLELFNRGIAPRLVLTRETFYFRGALVTSQRDQERIVALTPGTLQKMMVAEPTNSTRDEAIRTREFFRSHGWKRIVVVTSPLHTRRACATFEKVGMLVSCQASASRDLDVRYLSAAEDRVKAFQGWFYEFAGSLRYRQLGWI